MTAALFCGMMESVENKLPYEWEEIVCKRSIARTLINTSR